MREGPQLMEPQATRPTRPRWRGSGGRHGRVLVALAATDGRGPDGRLALAQLAHLRRGHVPQDGRPMVADRRSVADHPAGLRRCRSGSSSRSRCSGRSIGSATAPGSTTPDRYEAKLLPLARTSALWIWLAAFGLVAYWSRRLYGPRAMVLASWWFAISPNLLAHGPLVTMEIPILAAMTAMASSSGYSSGPAAAAPSSPARSSAGWRSPASSRPCWRRRSSRCCG